MPMEIKRVKFITSSFNFPGARLDLHELEGQIQRTKFKGTNSKEQIQRRTNKRNKSAIVFRSEARPDAVALRLAPNDPRPEQPVKQKSEDSLY